MVAAAAAVVLVAVACTGGGQPAFTETPPVRSSSSPSARPIGGPASLVLAAERWPHCLNPIKTCAGDWAWYTVLEHVLPRAMQLDPGGNYVPSVLLAEAPSLENGGLRRGPPFTVTFRIREEAVWDDGSPITSEDFAFTWRAILNTTNSAHELAYRAIRSIDTTDPKTVVIKFRDATARWPELFGGSRGFILKRAAFPKADPAKPNLRLAMWGRVPFSGGPWVLESWSRKRAVLIRNERYLGRRATLDRVDFIPRQDQVREAKSLLAGEVAAMYPQPSDVSFLDRCCPGTQAIGRDGSSFEALWFNTRTRPLNDGRVREALGYAVDRQAIVDNLVKLNNPKAEVLSCGFGALPDGPWCSSRPFERFSFDTARARQILEGAGYDCSGSPCVKNGQPLRIEYFTNPINPLQVAIEDLVIKQAAKAGFEIRVVQIEGGGVLFGNGCPLGFQVTQCAMPAPPDGSATHFLGCAAIPTERNREGENRAGWCNRDADRLMRESDRELDPARRAQLLSRVHEIEAEVFMGLPLFVMPAVSAWRTDRIAGPIGRYSSTPYGMFFNMNEWFVPAPASP